MVSNTTKNRSMNDADALIGAGIEFRFQLVGGDPERAQLMLSFRVEFTKNMLGGNLQGLQLQTAVNKYGAETAARYALMLNSGGVFTDAFTRDPWTAHNVNIVPFERELPELVEGGGRGWTAFDQADFSYDLERR